MSLHRRPSFEGPYDACPGLILLLPPLFSVVLVLSDMAVSGLLEPTTDHCENLARFALAALAKARETRISGDASLGHVSIRAGLATGRCVASVIGRVNPRFALFGEASAMASRLESHGMEDRIHVSKEVATRLQLRAAELHSTQLVSRGSVLIRGASSPILCLPSLI